MGPSHHHRLVGDGDGDGSGDLNSTALHLAMLVGSNESGRLLLRKGADVNASNNEGETPLMIAALKGYLEKDFCSKLWDTDTVTHQRAKTSGDSQPCSRLRPAN